MGNTVGDFWRWQIVCTLNTCCVCCTVNGWYHRIALRSLCFQFQDCWIMFGERLHHVQLWLIGSVCSDWGWVGGRLHENVNSAFSPHWTPSSVYLNVLTSHRRTIPHISCRLSYLSSALCSFPVALSSHCWLSLPALLFSSSQDCWSHSVARIASVAISLSLT